MSLPEQFITRLAEARAAQERMDRMAPVPLVHLPGNYHALTPEQQYEADMARRRAQVAAQRAAIAAAVTPQPGDDDVVQAEIVD